MKSSSATRRLGLSVVLALVLAVLVVPAVPAAADANDYWSLQSSPVTVRRDGVNYSMRITVWEYGSSEGVDIALSRRRNPDGVAEATQTHTFSFDMNAGSNRFTHPELNLSRAAFDSATEMGKYGRLDLGFAQDGALQTSCNKHNRSRVGKLSGTVNFKTQNARFDTITARPGRATLTFFDGECDGDGGGGGGTPCPSRSRTIFGSRYMNAPMFLSASKVDGADRAYLSVSHSEMLDNDLGSLSHALYATLPSSKFSLNDAATSGLIQSPAGIWLSGKGTYSAEGSSTSGATNCGGDKESLSRTSAGSLTGGLTVDFFMGPDRSIGQAPLDSASAYRTIVRMR